jgi:hypothetical protein
MRQPLPLSSAQIVVEREPLLRLCFADGATVDYELRPTQLLLLAQQALAAFQQGEAKAVMEPTRV